MYSIRVPINDPYTIKGEKMKTMRVLTKSRSMIGFALLLTVVLSACQPAAAVPAPGEAAISVATDPTLGKILVGNNDMTLYIYTKDTPDQSNCTGACLVNWPPLLTKGSPVLGAGVDKSLVGSAALADGTRIVTYNKMPLYYWAKDTKPGDTTGQNVGKVWFVIGPDGKVIGM
jgi:predicted lipoprotein with Yx(FWY)xxD motif